MLSYKILPLIFAFVLSMNLSAEPKFKVFNLASEELEDITQKDGKGCYWEIFEALFKDTGIKVNKLLFPYSQSQKRVQSKKIDAMLGYPN